MTGGEDGNTPSSTEVGGLSRSLWTNESPAGGISSRHSREGERDVRSLSPIGVSSASSGGEGESERRESVVSGSMVMGVVAIEGMAGGGV